jgi:hypothetical protein
MAIVELPDPEEMLKLVDEIYEITKKIGVLKLKIKLGESEVVLKANEFSNGKPPSMSFLQASYLVTGLNNELVPLREKLSELESELEHKKNKLEMYKLIVDIWRTQSANERLKL